MEHLARAIGVLKQTNGKLLAVLKRDSEVLERIHTDFCALIRSPDHLIQVTCFYEELPLPVVGLVSKLLHPLVLSQRLTFS